MLSGKIIPNHNISTSKTTLNFDGFVRILDKEIQAGENISSIEIPINGNVDKEVIIHAFRNANATASGGINVRLNNVSTQSYGRRYTRNYDGNIQGWGESTNAQINIAGYLGATDSDMGICHLFFESGYLPLAYSRTVIRNSGTKIRFVSENSMNFNSTSQITTLNIISGNGSVNFTPGTRIVVFKRSSQ